MNAFRDTLGWLGKWVGIVIGVTVAAGLGYGLRAGCAPRPLESVQAETEGEAAPEEQESQMWTCAMHPNLRLSAPGQCPICGMTLISVSSGAASDEAGLRVLAVSLAARGLMEIETTPVERHFVDAEVRMVGKVAPDETLVRSIAAWVPGRLDRLYVDFTGIRVEQGDHMVDIYSPQLLAAQEELLQAIETARKMEKSDLEVMRQTAQATVRAARDRLELWGLTDAQIARIEQSGETSDHVTIYAPIGGIVLHKTANEGMYVKTGTPLYSIADLSRVWVKMDAYESDLAWLRYGQRVSITAEAYPGETFEGRIAFIDPVVDGKTRTVKLRVNAKNPGEKLKPGMFVRAAAHATVAGDGQVTAPELAGDWVCPMHPGMVSDSPGVCDFCGMPLVTLKSLGYTPLAEANAKKPLVIPVSAALVTGKRAIVYIELPDRKVPTFEGREIVLGPRAGDYYIVRNGLREGEMVVTRGNFKIDSALQIQAKPSMMTPSGGGGGAPMHHGGGSGSRMAKEKSEPAKPLPEAFLEQLGAILAAHGSVTEAMRTGDADAVRTAFRQVGRAVGSVDAGQLTGRRGAMWREMAMLLGNDAVQGADAKTAEELHAALGLLNRHVAALAGQFGVRHGGAAQAAAPAGGEHGGAAQAVAPAGGEHGGAAQAAAPKSELVEPASATQGVPAEFREQLDAVLEAYTRVQAALVQDDVAGAARAAQAAARALAEVDVGLLSGDDHVGWTKLASRLRSSIEQVAGASDLGSARAAFAPLSEELAAALRRLGTPPGRQVYRLHCPMAFGGRGADWLQLDTKVRNPWLGPAMSKCGNVVETIPGRQDGGEARP